MGRESREEGLGKSMLPHYLHTPVRAPRAGTGPHSLSPHEARMQIEGTSEAEDKCLGSRDRTSCDSPGGTQVTKTMVSKIMENSSYLCTSDSAKQIFRQKKGASLVEAEERERRATNNMC